MSSRTNNTVGRYDLLTELGESFLELSEDVSEWSQATFGTDAERGPVGPLKHLEKECKETMEAVFKRDYLEVYQGSLEDIKDCQQKVLSEFADCLILVLDASRRAGITPLDLVRAAQDKMEVNRSRSYPKPNQDEVSEHVRDGESKE